LGDFFKQVLEGGTVAVFGGVPGPVEFVYFREVLDYFDYRGAHFFSLSYPMITSQYPARRSGGLVEDTGRQGAMRERGIWK
jgi:hypothetical protein